MSTAKNIAGISGETRFAVVLGDPVRHSRSPALHNAAFGAVAVDGAFLACEVAPAELGDAIAGLRALGFLGASITVPHKQAVMQFCDRIDSVAETIGAVNCLAFDQSGALVGHNTDAGGFADSLTETGATAQGKRVVLLGAGGAARAVAAGMHDAGASAVTVVARTPSKAAWADTYGGASAWTAESMPSLLGACDLLVDCTPVALTESGDLAYPAEVDVGLLPSGCVVASLIYHRKPGLLAAAESRGLETLDGAGMLVHQGARAFELWTGMAAPIDAMWRAMRSSLDG